MFWQRRPTYHWRLAVATAGLGLGLTLSSYLMAQQVVRLGANGVPAEVANAVAGRWDRQPAADLAGPNVSDPAGRLAPNIFMYNVQRRLIASNTGATTKADQPPAGSFDYAKKHGDNRFTWQPPHGQRQAAVLAFDTHNGGYVLATQSLKESEHLIDQLGRLALATLVGVTVLTIFVAVL